MSTDAAAAAAAALEARTERLKLFCAVVQGTATVKTKSVGMIRSHALDGQPNSPYYHQLRASSKIFNHAWALLAHAPGLGKTVTAYLSAAGIACRDGDNLRILITAPLSTLEQWYDTAQDWLTPQFASRVRIVRSQAELTKRSLARPQIIVCTHELLVCARQKCYYWEPHDRIDPRFHRHVGGWRRTPRTALHPLFTVAFDLFVMDEVHVMRNPASQVTLAHELVARNARHRLGLTGTPLYNTPLDMVGLATALQADAFFRSVNNWSSDARRQTINRGTSERWKKRVHRATDADLTPPLPLLDETYVSFDPGAIDHVAYNEYHAGAQEVRQRQQRGGARADDNFKLLVYLQKMQQALISPTLAEEGARCFSEHPHLIDEAAAVDLPSLKTLRAQVHDLQAMGIDRVVVACDRVMPLRIARAMLCTANVGRIFLYDGSLSAKARRDLKRQFLQATRAILLLSIPSGGTGLHIAPGANGMILWGSRPFSAQQVRQTIKRIHRIGQTSKVHVRHIVADRSVDAGIVEMHKSKTTLADAVVDGKWDEFPEAPSGDNEYRWHLYHRIMNYVAIARPDGVFAHLPPEQSGISWSDPSRLVDGRTY